MIRQSLTALLLICSVLSAASAQDFNAIYQEHLRQGQELDRRIQSAQEGIVNQNMQNPRVQAMYQQHLAQGGRMSFQEFAYMYGATAGFTPDGIQRWQRSETNIQQNEAQAMQRYREHQNQLQQQTFQQMQEQNQRWARQRGNIMNGTSDYRNPNDGTVHNLPNTVQPGTAVYDRGNDQLYWNGPQGQYQQQTSDGYWQDLEEEE
jgi:hypothetical protein